MTLGILLVRKTRKDGDVCKTQSDENFYLEQGEDESKEARK